MEANDDQKEAVAKWIKEVFEEHTCPSCKQHWDGKQIGPCVYCEHCNYRLYQGRLAKKGKED